jgi:ribosomal-protein-alanine N-acetyltransferase
MGAETMPARQSVAIRAMRPEDAAGVTRVLQQAPEAANWTEQSLEEALTWAGGVPLVSESDGEITGFLLGRQVGDEAEILNLGVLPAKRRRGEGAALLERALAEFRTRAVRRVFLEVRESNETAIGFYEKQEFSRTGRRPGYYREPAEAAVLMEKKMVGRD